MSEKCLYGPAGKYITVHDLDGLYLPPSPLDRYKQFRELKALSARDSDVLVCAYPKSGLHWIWEIVNMLIKGNADMSPSVMESSMLEFNEKEIFDKYNSPRIFASHLKYNQLPKSFRDKKTKIVYIMRDPRAVAVSYFYHMYQLKAKTNLTSNDWKAYLQMFMDGKGFFGSWFDAVRDWEKEIQLHRDHPIYIVYYENFKMDTFGEVQKLAKFLNAESSVDLYAKIAQNTELKKMKAVKEGMKKNFIKDYFKSEGYPFYRKGTVDDWKSKFSVKENEHFEEEFEKKMKGSCVRLKSQL